MYNYYKCSFSSLQVDLMQPKLISDNTFKTYACRQYIMLDGLDLARLRSLVMSMLMPRHCRVNMSTVCNEVIIGVHHSIK